MKSVAKSEKVKDGKIGVKVAHSKIDKVSKIKTKESSNEEKIMEISLRAQTIVGESIKLFNPTQVVNYAIYGDKNYLDYEIKDYVVYGKPSNVLRPGSVIIAKDHSHLGIIDSDAKYFFHASEIEEKVEKVDIRELKSIFPMGYLIRSN